jgi:hypothetical protein
MARRSNRVKYFPHWQSLLVAGIGGTVVALVDLFGSPSVVLYLAGIAGTFTAASVFKYGPSKGQEKFPGLVIVAAVLCIMGAVWAGLCRHILCLTLCAFWQLDLCKYCSTEFTRALIIIGGTISTLMGGVLSFTLGRLSLTHNP